MRQQLGVVLAHVRDIAVDHNRGRITSSSAETSIFCHIGLFITASSTFTCRGQGAEGTLSARAAGYSWRPGRVYFLTLLEPLAGTTGLWPLPPGRPAFATVALPGEDDE